MPPTTKRVRDEARRVAQDAAYDARKLDPEALLDMQIKLLEEAQSFVRKDLREGFGIDPKSIKAIQDLSESINAAVSTKLRWTTAMKKIGKDMTNNEKNRAAVDRIKAMPMETRRDVVAELVKYHAEQVSSLDNYNYKRVTTTAAARLAALGAMEKDGPEPEPDQGPEQPDPEAG